MIIRHSGMWEIYTHLHLPFNISYLRFFLDAGLTLLYPAKDGVSAEILVFSNIFGFPAVNWGPKRTKTVNF